MGANAGQRLATLAEVVVSSTGDEMRDDTGDLDASVEGDEQQVAVNGKYLKEAPEALDAPRCGWT